MYSFFHGFILSLGLILPLGVQNLFVFTQGAAQPSYLRALPSAITASLCDTLLILLAVEGISLLLLKFGFLKLFFVGVGAVFLFYMGFLAWRTSSGIDNNAKQAFSVKQQIFFAMTVSLLNPHAVLDTIGVIGTSAAQYQGTEKSWFTLACISVSWLWFFLLSAAGYLLKRRNWFAAISTWLNKISALFIWLSAVYMLYICLN